MKQIKQDYIKTKRNLHTLINSYEKKNGILYQ